jgi:uncharacterized membrane protein YqgA involved in biofilm formation
VNDTSRSTISQPPGFWRSTLVYSGSRVGVFAVLLGLLYVVGVRGVIVVLIALVLSGVLSYFLLDRQRSAFAAALEERVKRRRERAAAKSAREDEIADRLIAEEQARRSLSSSGPHDA